MEGKIIMENTVLKIKNFGAGFGDKFVLENINMDVEKNKVTSIMGPSGCGKTTLIRSINRLHELNETAITKGEILLNSENIFKMNSTDVRKKIGMVFQRPNPFPTMSIYENVIAGYTLNGIKLNKNKKDEIVEMSLEKSFLFDEVKDSLHKKGTFLSGGQQQRLCIARALAMKPDIILLDEATSALDPKATAKIEELIEILKKDVTILLVTHNISQAARVSDYIAFLYLGELIEYNTAEKMLTTPKHSKTEEYLTGKFS